MATPGGNLLFAQLLGAYDHAGTGQSSFDLQLMFCPPETFARCPLVNVAFATFVRVKEREENAHPLLQPPPHPAPAAPAPCVASAAADVERRAPNPS